MLSSKDQVFDNMDYMFSEVTKMSDHPDAGLLDFNGSKVFFSGAKFPLFNGILIREKPSIDADQYISDVVEYFKKYQVPFFIWWLDPNPIPKDFVHALDKYKLQNPGAYTGIAARIVDLKQSAKPQELTIAAVANEAEYSRFVDMIIEGFGIEHSAKPEFYYLMQEKGERKPFNHYLGWVDNVPVATLSTCGHGEVIGIYSITTLSKYQKRGISSAMVQYALHDAAQNGAVFAVAQLDDKSLARNLMLRMGFKEYCQFMPYIRMI